MASVHRTRSRGSGGGGDVSVCVRVGSIRKAAVALWVEPHYKQFQMWRLTGA